MAALGWRTNLDMKRLLAIAATSLLAVVAWAQAPFTIVRPADGAKVRETVRIQIPKGSIPGGSYVGIFVGGKFVEATILDLRGKYYEYLLDTKARKIPDGSLKIEAVLYADAGDKPRIVDRSSVEVNVVNVASIKVPDDGFLLRYRFVPSTELNYTIQERTSISTISVSQARLGGRAAQLPFDADTFRMLYAIDNKYSNGDGLIRMQPLPDKNKDSAIVRTIDNPDGRQFMDYEMAPLYMRISNTGREQFGSVPLYVPLEGTAGEALRTDLFTILPLPSLPEKRVRPGDAWQSRIHLGKLDMQNLQEASSLTIKQMARGELQGVEWEMGHPCAKIRYSIAAGQGLRTTPGQTAGGIADDKVQLEQTLWFAMDRGVVVKSILDITRDVKSEQAPGMMGGGPAGPSGPPGVGVSGPRGGRGGGSDDIGGNDRSIVAQRGPRGPGPSGGPGGIQRPGVGTSGGIGGRMGGPGAGAGAGRAGGTAEEQLVRLRQQIVMTLER